jgi:hypothetical protein
MLLLVLALWKRGGVTAWMSVRSIGAFARDTYATARENVATRVFFRSRKTSHGTGRGWARAASARSRKTHPGESAVADRSAAGRERDEPVRAVEWSAGSGRQRRFGVWNTTDARERGSRAFRRRWAPRDAVSRRRGAAGRARDGIPRRHRRGMRTRAIAATPWGPRVPPPSPRSPPSPTPRSRSATSPVQEHPRPRSSRSGRSRAARAREADARTNAPPRFLEGARTPRSDRSRDGRARLRTARGAEMRSAGNLPARVQSAGRRGRAETKRNARVRVFAHRRGGSDCWSAIRIDDTGGGSCGFRDVACRLSPPRALLRARVTQPLATQET